MVPGTDPERAVHDDSRRRLGAWLRSKVAERSERQPAGTSTDVDRLDHAIAFRIDPCRFLAFIVNNPETVVDNRKTGRSRTITH